MVEIKSRVQVCGSFAMTVDGREVGTQVPLGQARTLATFLVLHRDREHERAELIEALWPQDVPAAADRSLAALLSRLRGCLGSEILAPRRGVRLRLPQPTWVDLEVCREAAHRADAAVRRNEWTTAWTAARTALNISVRPLLPGVSLPWLDHERRRLRDVRLRAWEAVGETSLGLGGSELVSARRAAEELIAEDPLSEIGYRLAMRTALARGNPAEAVACFHRARKALSSELGVDPGPDTRALLEEALKATSPQRSSNVGASNSLYAQAASRKN